MYEYHSYHSARNMVQLIGAIVGKPQVFRADEDEPIYDEDADEEEDEEEVQVFVRLMIETRDRDNNFEAFYTKHVVVIPLVRVAQCSRYGISQGDIVLIRGRIHNNRKRNNELIDHSIQASEILRLEEYKNADERFAKQNKEAEKRQVNKEHAARYREMLEDDNYWKGKRSGKVVSLLDKKLDKEHPLEDYALRYEDEDDDRIPF